MHLASLRAVAAEQERTIRCSSGSPVRLALVSNAV